MVLMTSSVPTANHVTALFATTTCSTVVGVAANRPAPFEAGRFGFSKVPDITFSLRYGIFFPGAAIITDDKPRQFFGAGVTYAF